MDGKSATSEKASTGDGTPQTVMKFGAPNVSKCAPDGRKPPTSARPAVPQDARRRPGRPRVKLPWQQQVSVTLDPPKPTPTSYFVVLRPERTYERRPTACPALRQEPPKRVLEQPEDPNGRSCRSDALSTAHMLTPVIDFPGPRVPPKVPVAAEVSGTTGLLCSQLDKLQKAAKSGNEGALLLLEQYKAFGKQRHHFSERMLLKCARWRARSCYSYHCARRTQLFTLPGRTTLHRYGQLASSS